MQVRNCLTEKESFLYDLLFMNVVMSVFLITVVFQSYAQAANSSEESRISDQGQDAWMVKVLPTGSYCICRVPRSPVPVCT